MGKKNELKKKRWRRKWQPSTLAWKSPSSNVCVRAQSCPTLCNPMDCGQILSDSIRFFKWATSKFKKKKGSIVIVDSLLGYPMHYPQVYKTHKKVNCVE